MPGLVLAKVPQSPPLFGGRYETLRSIGRGGMGEVFEAEERGTKTRVALKTVKLPDTALLQSLRREIRALARLQHPGIVRILAEGVEQGVPWYAMELVEGVTLRQYRKGLASEMPGPLGAEGLVPLLQVIRLLAGALAYLHGEGIVHQDLKPGNVLVRPDGRPVLVDFGLAGSLRGAVSREELTLAQWSVGGTVPYMAPEQILGAPADPRFDLYALGCLIYELVSGHRPIETGSMGEVLKAHSRQPIPPLLQVAPEVPAGLSELVQRLLEMDPRRRLGYAADVVLALEKLGAGDLEWEAAPRCRAYVYRPGLAGRQSERQRLTRILERLRQGQGGAILLGGESGVGKTRLLTEMGKKAVEQGVVVLPGECRDRGGRSLEALRQPLQAIADRCRSQGAAETRRVFGVWAGVLAPYELSLQNLPGLPPDPKVEELAPREARLRVFQALRGVFEAVAAEASLVIVLDDLQWGDGLTLDFLHSTLASDSLPFLWVGAYRTEEAAAGHLAPLLQSGSVRHLELPRLTEAEVGPIVSDMLALDWPMPGLDRMLALHSEGNPFFIAEYLLAAVEEGWLVREPGGHWRLEGPTHGENPAPRALPTVLHQLLKRRLTGLSDSALLLTQAAAVLGRESRSVVLELMVGFPSEREFLDAVHELLRHRVLEEAADGPERLRFVHDKIREVAFADLGAEPRKALHRAAAQALQSQNDEQDAAALAQHWEAAGHPEAARRWSLAAARLARNRYALQEAESFFLASIRLAAQVDEECVRARLELGEGVLSVAGRNQDALEQHVQALVEAQKLGEPGLLADSLRLLGGVHHMLGQVHEAQEHYQQALELHRQTGQKPGEAYALRGMASLLQEQGRGRDALPLQTQALRLFEELGDRKGQGHVLLNLGLIHQEQGWRGESLAFYQQAVAILRHFQDRFSLGRALLNLANLYMEGGEFDLAERTYQESLALRRAIGDKKGQGLVLLNLANLKGMMNRPGDAQPLFQQALILLRQTGHQRGEAFCYGSLAGCYHDQGRIASAKLALERGLDLFRQLGDLRGQCLALNLLSKVYRRSGGDLTQSMAFAQEAEGLARQIGDKAALTQVLAQQGMVLLASGLSAREKLEQVHALVQELGNLPQSDWCRIADLLGEAQERFDAGQLDRLYQGERIEDRLIEAADPDAGLA